MGCGGFRTNVVSAPARRVSFQNTQHGLFTFRLWYAHTRQLCSRSDHSLSILNWALICDMLSVSQILDAIPRDYRSSSMRHTWAVAKSHCDTQIVSHSACCNIPGMSHQADCDTIIVPLAAFTVPYTAPKTAKPDTRPATFDTNSARTGTAFFGYIFF